MAGAPWQIPAGTIGPRGMDLSPWMQMAQMRQQAAQEYQRKQQADQQFASELAFRDATERTRSKLDELRVKVGAESDRERTELSKLELAQRGEQAKEGAALEREGLSLKAKQLESEDKDRVQRTQRVAELETKEKEKEAKSTALIDFETAFRGDLESSANEMKRMGGDPDTIYEKLMAATARMDVPPEQRAIAQALVREWYDSTTKRETQAAIRAEQKERIDIARMDKESTIAVREEAEQRRAGEAMTRRIAQRTTPIRRQQEALAKQYDVATLTMQKTYADQQIQQLEPMAAQGDDKAVKALAQAKNIRSMADAAIASFKRDYQALEDQALQIEQEERAKATKPEASAEPEAMAGEPMPTGLPPELQSAIEQEGGIRAVRALRGRVSRSPKFQNALEEWLARSGFDPQSAMAMLGVA